MWVTWFVLGFFQALLSRWFPFLTTYSGYFHAAIGVLVMLGTLTGAIILVSHFGTGIDLLNSHEKAGWSVVFILLFFVITGFGSFIAKRVFKWNSKAIKTFRWVHRIIAYGMFGLVTYTIYAGLKHHIS